MRMLPVKNPFVYVFILNGIQTSSRGAILNANDTTTSIGQRLSTIKRPRHHHRPFYRRQSRWTGFPIRNSNKLMEFQTTGGDAGVFNIWVMSRKSPKKEGRTRRKGAGSSANSSPPGSEYRAVNRANPTSSLTRTPPSYKNNLGISVGDARAGAITLS